MKWNCGEIIDLWVCLAGIEAGEAPVFAILFGAAQNVDHPIDKRVTADFRADIECAQNVAVPVEFHNPVLIPLTQVEVLAVVTEIRAGELRARDALVLTLAAARHKAAQAIIVRSLAEREPTRVAG